LDRILELRDGQLGVRLLVVVLMCGAAACAVGWIIGMIEGFATLLFQPWAYEIGPLAVQRESASSKVDPLVRPAQGAVDATVYRVVGGRCLFRARAFPPRRGLRTPFQIKGAMYWNGRAVKIVGRFPLGSTIFISGVLAAWSAMGLLWAIRSSSAAGWLPLVLGCGTVGALVVYSRRYERRRFEVISEDVLSCVLRRED
jgi:hypothetical protein